MQLNTEHFWCCIMRSGSHSAMRKDGGQLQSVCSAISAGMRITCTGDAEADDAACRSCSPVLRAWLSAVVLPGALALPSHPPVTVSDGWSARRLPSDTLCPLQCTTAKSREQKRDGIECRDTTPEIEDEQHTASAFTCRCAPASLLAASGYDLCTTLD